jgi:hypothetical protein
MALFGAIRAWNCSAANLARTRRISAMWNRIPIEQCPGQVGVCYPLDCRPGLSGNIGLTLVESECGAVAVGRTYLFPPFRLAVPHWFDPGSVSTPTGSPEAVARPGSHRTWRADFPHQRSSAVASHHCKRLQLPVGEAQFRRQQRCPFFDSVESVPGEACGPSSSRPSSSKRDQSYRLHGIYRSLPSFTRLPGHLN